MHPLAPAWQPWVQMYTIRLESQNQGYDEPPSHLKKPAECSTGLVVMCSFFVVLRVLRYLNLNPGTIAKYDG